MRPPHLTLQMRAILDELRHTRGSPIPMSRLVAALYAKRHDGGPDNPEVVIRVQIHRMRAELARHGILILTIGGRGGGAIGYMIDPDSLDLVEAVIATSRTAEIDHARACEQARLSRLRVANETSGIRSPSSMDAMEDLADVRRT